MCYHCARNKGNTLPLRKKLDVIKRYERNELTVDIAIAIGIPESTLRTIKKQAEKVMESCKNAERMKASEIEQIRRPTMEKLERMLEIGSSMRAIVDIARTVGFEDVDKANVEEILFQSYALELSNESLLELEKELNDQDDDSSDVKPVKHLPAKQFLSTLTFPLAT
jgi:hypothetical protein